ncbi:MAG: endonuclease III domain-containing protein [Halanaerobiales bacterium]|nr:endonuclease III domain-containing protein [Halanaerobiales bacterium]
MFPCSNLSENKNISKGLHLIYEKLYLKFGPQDWWPADSKLEIIIGAILTQAVSWSNVEMAISNLKDEKLLDIKKLHQINENRLAKLIKPSGYYNMKAKKLKSFIDVIVNEYNSNLDAFGKGKPEQKRKELLEIYGIGPETADSILLYAYQKPVFVIDTYTKRILSRTGYIKKNISYEKLQAIIENNIETNQELFNEYHALLVKLAKENCWKSSPLCEECPLNKHYEEEKYAYC